MGRSESIRWDQCREVFSEGERKETRDRRISIGRAKLIGPFGPSERSNGLGPSDADQTVLNQGDQSQRYSRKGELQIPP